MRTSVQKLLRALEILAWAAFFACAIGFLAVRYWLVPSAERYREDIVAAISRGIGLPVKIGGTDSGLDVIVQENYRQTIGQPLADLRRGLILLSLVTLGLSASVIVPLWGVILRLVR